MKSLYIVAVNLPASTADLAHFLPPLRVHLIRATRTCAFRNNISSGLANLAIADHRRRTLPRRRLGCLPMARHVNFFTSSSVVSAPWKTREKTSSITNEIE